MLFARIRLSLHVLTQHFLCHHHISSSTVTLLRFSSPSEKRCMFCCLAAENRLLFTRAVEKAACLCRCRSHQQEMLDEGCNARGREVEHPALVLVAEGVDRLGGGAEGGDGGGVRKRCYGFQKRRR
eukprot:6210775-Pleurochrysis_carterae.AAC.1